MGPGSAGAPWAPGPWTRHAAGGSGLWTKSAATWTRWKANHESEQSGDFPHIHGPRPDPGHVVSVRLSELDVGPPLGGREQWILSGSLRSTLWGRCPGAECVAGAAPLHFPPGGTAPLPPMPAPRQPPGRNGPARTCVCDPKASREGPPLRPAKSRSPITSVSPSSRWAHARSGPWQPVFYLKDRVAGGQCFGRDWVPSSRWGAGFGAQDFPVVAWPLLL